MKRHSTLSFPSKISVIKLLYLHVYKPHFFDKNLPSKIGVQLVHGTLKNNLDRPIKKSRYHVDDWAHDAGIVCCETPSRGR
jgi:hypothetical protein